MNCEEAAALLAADLDGEVDGLRSHALRKHAAGCPACGPRLQAMLELKRRLRAELPYHAAPTALRARLAAEFGAVGVRRAAPERRWRWFAGGVLAGAAAAALVWLTSAVWLHGSLGEDLPTRLVGLHSRATLGNHLIEVASSDRHTVRPWLSARLDYAIPVADWASVGYTLVGARIDHLDRRPVAVLVYRHRDHVIDVFVRPVTSRAPEPTHRTVRGFNVARAEGAEMEWLGTSDLNGADLDAFLQGLARGKVAAVAD